MTRPTRTICSRKVEVLVYCECEEQRRNRRNGFPPFHTKTAITQAVWSVSIAWRPIWYNWKVVSSEFSKFAALSDWSVANTMIIDYGRGSRWVTGLLWHDPVVSYGAIILFRGCVDDYYVSISMIEEMNLYDNTLWFLHVSDSNSTFWDFPQSTTKAVEDSYQLHATASLLPTC